jgi:nicotinamide mononucleotide adenylyltransferase
MIRVIQDDGAIFIWQRHMGDVVPGAHDVVGWNALVTFICAEMGLV